MFFLRWAFIALVVALVASALGYATVAGGAWTVAGILLVCFVASLVAAAVLLFGEQLVAMRERQLWQRLKRH
jgi:uncharacterized membrane protein YtjA (UPF0391 family)